MHKHTFLAAAGAFLLAVGSAHANTVSGAGSDSSTNVIFASSFAIYLGVPGPMLVQFTLEPEIIQGNSDAFWYELVIRSGDDGRKILDLSGNLELEDNENDGSDSDDEFQFDFLIMQSSPGGSGDQGLLGTLLGMVSFTFPEPGAGGSDNGYFSEMMVGLAPEPKALFMVGVALIILSLIGHKRRQH